MPATITDHFGARVPQSVVIVRVPTALKVACTQHLRDGYRLTLEEWLRDMMENLAVQDCVVLDSKDEIEYKHY